MNVFVTGATGVLGREVVTTLAAQGHTVRGVARTDEKARWLRDRGAEPVGVDLFDAAAVKDAVAGSDAVLHLATSIPPMKDMRRSDSWTTNNRLRTVSTRLLVDAALAHGVSAVVAESISFCYPDRGAEWIDESVPFVDEPWLHAVIDLEQEVARFAQHGGRGVSLRFGSFYGPEARIVDEMLVLARRGLAPYLGDPDAYVASIHTDDAASATVAALQAASGAYNVCDDPLPRRVVAEAFASAFGTKRLRFGPGFLQRFLTRKTGDALMRSHRVSNQRFRLETGWAPTFADVRDGFIDVAQRHQAAS
jgi:nucleoside-diphosphate-sugar epimerase